MKIIRKLLYEILGFELYLLFISKLYISLIKLGFFKKRYAELHFIKKLVKPGYHCIDIGANLGYYSYFLCKATRETGKITAVEPVEIFRKILKSNIKKLCKKNFTLLPYALGSENKTITMGMPVLNGIIHHGMTHVITDNSQKQNIEKTFEVEMKIPDELFANIERLHFIKCDVEGYEYFVFSNMKNILYQHKPIIQCELSEQNKKETIQLLKNLNYDIYILNNNKLQKQADDFILKYKNDVYFIPQDNNILNELLKI